ncbi:MAG TPA: 3-deoxy-manno-octulosonate cytidylyltransferase [Coxiellaceae bacterium]|nr:3-deoxy-manno-octulosonate cytidylyltransferase [Coxiellaceae bacterium]
MKILCVIPSRIASTRLARKPLLNIQGKPMVQWTYENASRCKALTEVVVATDSDEVATLVKNCNGKVVMTDPNIQTGSDRVAVVAEQYPDMDVIINLQGDEPFIKASMLEALVKPYLDGEKPEMTTLAYPILTQEEFNDPGAVKVVLDQNQNALYFSRSAIPYFRVQTEAPVYHHMGLYAFRRDFLLKYTTFAQTPLEKAEALEQLRVLENGYKIRVCLTEERTLEINTPEELALAQNFKYQA